VFSSFVLDTIELIDSASFVLEAVEGLDMPDYRVGAYENPGEDGGTVASAFYGSRTLTLSGTVAGTDSETYQANRQALAYACRVRKDGSGFPTPMTITFTTLDGDSYFLFGYVKSPRIETKYLTFGKFLITIIVPDPMIYLNSQLTSGQVTRPTGGGATWPITWPAIWGTGTGGSATIFNSGNADTWPILTLRGTHTNPYLYSAERGKNLKLNYTTTNVTDVIVIDMANKTIMLNGVTNLLSAKDVDSDWFSLRANSNNTILFSSSSSSDTGTLEVTAYPAFVGV